MARVFVEVYNTLSDEECFAAIILLAVSSPWWLPLFSPSIYAISYIVDLNIHTLFKIMLSIGGLAFNVLVVVVFFRMLPSMVASAIGAIYSGAIMWLLMIVFFEVSDLVWIWAAVILASLLGGANFFCLSDKAKGFENRF